MCLDNAGTREVRVVELDSRPSFKAGVCTVLPLTVSRIRYSSVQEMVCHPAPAIRQVDYA